MEGGAGNMDYFEDFQLKNQKTKTYKDQWIYSQTINSGERNQKEAQGDHRKVTGNDNRQIVTEDERLNY